MEIQPEIQKGGAAAEQLPIVHALLCEQQPCPDASLAS
jgi:hypothetical protein